MKMQEMLNLFEENEVERINSERNEKDRTDTIKYYMTNYHFEELSVKEFIELKKLEALEEIKDYLKIIAENHINY